MNQKKIIEERIVKLDGEEAFRRFAKGRFLGKGGFARCYEFTSLETNKVMAAKIISKASLARDRTKQKLMNEIKLHRTLSHPHIVGFEHFFEDSDNVYILLEFCPNQSLADLLRQKKRLDEDEVQKYCRQIVSALKYLRNRRIVHRDLKLSNVLLTRKMQVKLSDFGLAAQLDTENHRRHSICGTQNYLAPEVLDSKQGHAFEVDVWALGVVMYILLVGRGPYDATDVKTTYRRIRTNAYSFPEHIPLSDAVKDLISSILVIDPESRPSLEAVESHLFFRQSTVPRLISKQETDFQLVKASNPQSDVRVSKWVDYSSKYGLGYVLSNGQTGVCFNDATKMVLQGTQFVFIERIALDDVATTYTVTDYPPGLYKKVSLLHQFQSYLKAEKATAHGPTIYVKRWMKTKRAIVFRLSSKVLQVQFQDKTEVLLSSATQLVTYTNKQGKQSVFEIAKALRSDYSEMTKRLQYTKEVLSNIIGS